MSSVTKMQMLDLKGFLKVRLESIKNPEITVIGFDIELPVEIEKMLLMIQDNTQFNYSFVHDGQLIETIQLRGNLIIKIKSDNSVLDLFENFELKKIMNVGLFIQYEDKLEKSLIESVISACGYKIINSKFKVDNEVSHVDISEKYLIIRLPYFKHQQEKFIKAMNQLEYLIKRFRDEPEIDFTHENSENIIALTKVDLENIINEKASYIA